jgi:heme/copper-type cytochrome/quinol oxidase subunit 2
VVWGGVRLVSRGKKLRAKGGRREFRLRKEIKWLERSVTSIVGCNPKGYVLWVLRRGSFSFQNIISEVGRKVELLFYLTIAQMMLVAVGVLGMIGINYFKGGFYRYEKAVSYYEVLWTVLPTIILCTVAGPSIYLLYSHEQERERSLSVKCVGHQWYWRYEYGDLAEVRFDRLMLPAEELQVGECRLLEADMRAVVPVSSVVQFLVSREDVIHAWTLPAKGIKIDATPGRLNRVTLFFRDLGIFYGQCRELCGANHRLMPVVVEVTTPSLLVEWLRSV